MKVACKYKAHIAITLPVCCECCQPSTIRLRYGFLGLIGSRCFCDKHFIQYRKLWQKKHGGN